MSGELTLNGSISFEKGRVAAKASGNVVASVVGTKAIKTLQMVGIVAEPLEIGDVVLDSGNKNKGHLFMENLSNEFSVLIRAGASGDDLIRIEPQRFAGPIQLASDEVYLITESVTDGDTCLVQFTYVEQ